MKKETEGRITLWGEIAILYLAAFLTGFFAIDLNPIALVFLAIAVGLFYYRKKRGFIAW